MFVKSTVIYLDTSTFSEKTRCNFGVAMATIRWLLSLCYSNNRNRYSKPVLYVKVEDTCSQVLWQKGSSRKDDWERRTSIRSGPFAIRILPTFTKAYIFIVSKITVNLVK